MTLAAAAALAGCMKKSERYCQLNDDPAHCPPMDATNLSCTGPDDCTSAMAPACDTATMTCVECVAPDQTSACAAAEVCRTDNTCGPCKLHVECASGVCQADGACAAEADVAYVQAGGSGSECSRIAPCGDLATAEGLNRAVILVEGDITIGSTTFDSPMPVAVYGAPGAVLRADSGVGNLIDVRATANVAMYDLEITGGQQNQRAAIEMTQDMPRLALHRVLVNQNAGLGIEATVGTLTIDRSIVSRNIGGGAQVVTGFTITSSLFVHNGSTNSTIGGVELRAAPGGAPARFELNTVADNNSDPLELQGRGVNCLNAVMVRSSIVANNNTVAGVDGTCIASYVLYHPSPTIPPAAPNRAGDPMFKTNNLLNPRHPEFFRIGDASAAKDGGDPALAAAMPRDIDGQMRPQGAAIDIGADEVP